MFARRAQYQENHVFVQTLLGPGLVYSFVHYPTTKLFGKAVVEEFRLLLLLLRYAVDSITVLCTFMACFVYHYKYNSPFFIRKTISNSSAPY